jgi:hypothetical protein
MIQVYIPVRPGRRVTLPASACDQLGVQDGDWLRLSALTDGRAVLELVRVVHPDPVGPIPGFPAEPDP